MIGNLLILGITLSLDNFRTAAVLGGLRLGWRRSAQIAVTFGFWDGLAPLVGILIGGAIGDALDSAATYVGAGTLGLFGLYLVIQAWRAPEEPEEVSFRFALFGLPVPLSVDNVLAGASLGLLGYSPWLAPPLFGVITAVMSIAGLQLGRVVARFIRIRSDLLTGAALLIMAPLLGLGILG